MYPYGQSIFHTLVTTKHILQYNVLQKSVISGDECVLKIIPLDFCVNPRGTSDLQRVSNVGLWCFLCCLPEQAFEHTDSRDAGDFRRHGAYYVTSLQCYTGNMDHIYTVMYFLTISFLFVSKSFSNWNIDQHGFAVSRTLMRKHWILMF